MGELTGPEDLAPRGVVFVDADDTLWENNRFFTRVIDEWAEFLRAFAVERDTALLTLHEEEDRNIPHHGYGARPFCHSLRTAFARLVTSADATDRAAFETFVRGAETAIRDHRIELLPGVEEGLAGLASAGAHLVVLTKGQDDEQTAKVERSGLRGHFRALRVVPEKDVPTYVRAARDEGASPGQCWMIGNSPRSDINPAREAGFRTVYVPHPAPWHRELAPLVEGGHETVVVRSFADVPRAVLRTG